LKAFIFIKKQYLPRNKNFKEDTNMTILYGKKNKKTREEIEQFQIWGYKKALYKIKTCKERKSNKYDYESITEQMAWHIKQTHTLTDKDVVIVGKYNPKFLLQDQMITQCALFRRYVKKAGLYGKGYTPHKCRHTFASLLFQNGVDILTIQQLLGHSDLNTTKVYTHTTTDFLRAEVAKFPTIITS
jgi:site-specific recombinase XerD